MPRLYPDFLSAVFTAQNFFWVFQFTGGTIIEKIIINPPGNCFFPIVLKGSKHLIGELSPN
jgi:hypothetical protein